MTCQLGSNLGNDFKLDRMTKKNTCDQPWLVCCASIINPKNLGLRLGCYCINKKKLTITKSLVLN